MVEVGPLQELARDGPAAAAVLEETVIGEVGVSVARGHVIGVPDRN